jgi:predicted Zn-dependent protease
MDYTLELIKEADQLSKEVHRIVSIIMSILCVTDDKILVTSESTRIYQIEPSTMGTISVVAKESGKISWKREK